jgi:CRISPR-associated protein Csh1
MINELAHFVEILEQDHPLSDILTIDQLSDGLYIMVSFQEGSGEPVQRVVNISGKNQHLGDQEEDYLYQTVLPRYPYVNYINSNKAISDKKVHSATPYAFKLKKQSLEDQAWMQQWQVTTDTYIREAIKKTQADHTEEEQQLLADFQGWIQQALPDYVRSLDEYQRMKSGDYITVINTDFSPEAFRKVHDRHLKANLFNKNDYTREAAGTYYGLSDFHNGDNTKKPYLQHKNTPFDINQRISQETALKLKQLQDYMEFRAIKTNPLPIFVDYEELNKEVVNILRKEGQQISFHEIINQLFKRNYRDLGNYYLITILGNKILDVDFVSNFQFELPKTTVIDLFGKGENGFTFQNIFEFEHKVVQVMFSNKLVQQLPNNKGFNYRYFTDIDQNPNTITDTQWHLVMSYRKAFYDYVYKSRRQAVTPAMFHNIMEKGILDNLFHDELNDNGSHSQEKNIKDKLNIWLNLWNFFQQSSNSPDMANKVLHLQERMRELRDAKGDAHIQNDDEFAFAAGQLIFFLLKQSQSGNLTHAALEPFIQKRKGEEFKKAVASTFDAYKHELDFGSGRFEKLMGEVMGYEYEGDVKSLMPLILSGYFSNSIILEKAPENANQNA